MHCRQHVSSNLLSLTLPILILHFFVHKVIFSKPSSKTHREVNVLLKTDEDILTGLQKALQNAKSILKLLDVHITKESFLFKNRVDSVFQVKKEEITDEVDEDPLNDEMEENLHEEESLNDDTQESMQKMTDLAIIRKYCGNYIEKCKPKEGKCSLLNP